MIRQILALVSVLAGSAGAFVVGGCGVARSPSAPQDAGGDPSAGGGVGADAGFGRDAGPGADGNGCVVSTASGVGSNDAGYGCRDAGLPGFCDNGVRQDPTTCDPIVDALLSRTPLSCASKNSAHSYDLDSDPADPDTLAHRVADMCNLAGAVYWVADMDIDCDGVSSSVCPGTGLDQDPSYQSDTAVHTSSGSPLNSAADEYVVIPNDNSSGFAPGAVVAVIYGTRLTYAVFGDTGPKKIIGEGSVGLANALGIPPSPARGGVLGNTVTYIAFTGAGGVPGNIEDRASIVALGQSLTKKLLQDNAGPSGPGAPGGGGSDGGSGGGAEGGGATDAAGD